MASSGKKKTTMAKLQRENRLREKRMEKQARKDERKRTGIEEPEDLLEDESLEPVVRIVGGVVVDAAGRPLT